MARLRVDTDGVQVMAARWISLASELRGAGTPGLESGLACQPSAAAMNAGHADIGVVTVTLAGRVESGATEVAAADAGYIANEADVAVALAEVADPVIEA